jgi:GNAT superfamily N-acetyltransferase
MIEATLDDHELYPDSLVCEILAAQEAGHPGVSNWTDDQRDVFVWCDKTRTPRGVLTIGAEAASSGWITGGEFTILVHPAWRRRGIATKLYQAAEDFYRFELETDPLYTNAGAAWANAIVARSKQPPEARFIWKADKGPIRPRVAAERVVGAGPSSIPPRRFPKQLEEAPKMNSGGPTAVQ